MTVRLFFLKDDSADNKNITNSLSHLRVADLQMLQWFDLKYGTWMYTRVTWTIDQNDPFRDWASNIHFLVADISNYSQTKIQIMTTKIEFRYH